MMTKTTTDRVLCFVREVGETTVAQVAASCGLSQKHALDALGYLKNRGLLERGTDGVWREPSQKQLGLFGEPRKVKVA